MTMSLRLTPSATALCTAVRSSRRAASSPPEVVKAIRDLSPLAPLHNPAAILGIEASYKVFGEDKPNVAVFDTAFHSTMPPEGVYVRYSLRVL